MHPEVSRQLFDDAVRGLANNRDLLADRGWLILDSEFPSLKIAVRHRKSKRLRIFAFEFPDWDDTPPSLKLVDAETGEDLPGKMWPSGTSHWHQQGWSSAANITTPMPFLCMVGIHEYHTHYSHVNDSWDKYKKLPGYDLVDIIIQATAAFQQANV